MARGNFLACQRRVCVTGAQREASTLDRDVMRKRRDAMAWRPLDSGSDAAYYSRLRCITKTRGSSSGGRNDGGLSPMGSLVCCPCSATDGRSSVLRAALHDSREVPSGGLCKAGSSLYPPLVLFSCTEDWFITRIRTSVRVRLASFVLLGIGWDVDGYKLAARPLQHIPVLFHRNIYRHALESQH